MDEFKLQYAQEHVTCKNYAPDDSILRICTWDRGESMNSGSDHRSFLLFLLQGSIRCRCNAKTPCRIASAEMSFMPRGDAFRFEALEPSVALLCILDASIALCNEYSIKKLSEYRSKQQAQLRNPELPVVLPINDLLFSELDTTRAAMASGLLCQHYQMEKRDIFLLMLRGFYTKEALSDLFQPILSLDFDFKQQILRIYTPAMNVEEMIERTGLPTTSFNRKFARAFETTPRRWLIDRKKKDILTDLSMGDMPIKEIACKYGFTPNYFNEFCRLQLGDTPSELRKHEIPNP